eukprot:355382-Chlamydomonas_euryale.AAC.1
MHAGGHEPVNSRCVQPTRPLGAGCLASPPAPLFALQGGWTPQAHRDAPALVLRHRGSGCGSGSAPPCSVLEALRGVYAQFLHKAIHFPSLKGVTSAANRTQCQTRGQNGSKVASTGVVSPLSTNLGVWRELAGSNLVHVTRSTRTNVWG